MSLNQSHMVGQEFWRILAIDIANKISYRQSIGVQLCSTKLRLYKQLDLLRSK